MTHIRFRIFMMTLAVTLMIISPPVFAEIYKYTDQNGIVHYTDNLTTVPESYHQKLERTDEIPRPWPVENTAIGVEMAEDDEKAFGRADDEPARPRAQTPQAESAPIDSAAVEELTRKRSALTDKKEKLNQEYQSLLKQRRQLEAENEELDTSEAVENYNQQVQVLNEKIQEYREKRSRLEVEIQEFNATLKPPETSQDE